MDTLLNFKIHVIFDIIIIFFFKVKCFNIKNERINQVNSTGLIKINFNIEMAKRFRRLSFIISA